MTPREAYRILELSIGASAEEVRAAYKLMGAVWHPDRFQADSKLSRAAHEKFKALKEAYELLAKHVGATGEAPNAHADMEVRYMGIDPRLPLPSLVNMESLPCAVRISKGGLQLALVNGDEIIREQVYLADDIEGVYYGAGEWTDDGKSKNVRTDQFGRALPILVKTTWLVCRDPGGIVPRLIVKLGFRTEYHSELFFRTVLSFTGFERCDTAKAAPEPPERSAPKSTTPPAQDIPIRDPTATAPKPADQPAQTVRTPPQEPPSPTQEALPRQPTAANPKPVERSPATNSEPKRQVQSPPQESRSTAQQASTENPVATNSKPQSTEPRESFTAAASSTPRPSVPLSVSIDPKPQAKKKSDRQEAIVIGLAFAAPLLCSLAFMWDLYSDYLKIAAETRPDETANTVQEIPHLPVAPPPTSSPPTVESPALSDRRPEDEADLKRSDSPKSPMESSPRSVEPPTLSHQIPVDEADPKNARPPESPKVSSSRSVPSEAQRLSSREYEALGRAYLKRDILVSAIAAFTEAIRSDPSNSTAWNNRGHAYSRSRNWMSARSDFESALQINPENASSANNLAWLLVTSDDRSLRDPEKGLTLALRACALTKPETPFNFYGTLAAAFAATGDFKSAVIVQQLAVKGAGKSEQPAMLSRLELYRQEKVDWD